MAKYGIGQAITRREDLRLLLGTGQYVDDMTLPGEVHAIFVRSPHAHARIVSIDASAAKSAPGVLAVLTGADLKADGVGALPIGPGLVRADGKPMDAPPNYPLAVDTVRYVGEAVVAVIADTLAQVQDAAEQVQVEYEELPAVVTIAQAKAKDAPQLWPGAPGNIAAQTEFGNKDDTDAGFAKAKHVTRLSLHNQRLVPVTMEPRGSIGDFDEKNGRVILWTSCQNPAGLQGTLADAVLKIPKDKVRVRVGDVGGGFGMKTELYPEDCVCAYAARKLKKPVHWRATRSEEFLAGNHGRDQSNRAELAFDGDGRICGLRVEVEGSIGAHAIQIAKSMGAVVTGVDIAIKEKFIRRMGADHFVDYTKENFTELGRSYDVIFDMVPGSSYAACIRALNAKGRYMSGNPRLSVMLRSVLTTRFTDKTARFGFARELKEELLALKEMIESGKIVSIVDKVYPMELAADAHRRVETEQRLGAVVIKIGDLGVEIPGE